ncbi:flagellar hook-basal body complex protein [uncultured Clostridium sp.]|jgi:flagellar basal-body rod protein FlgG|uniref:flagellar hook-basal body complex protein n=1 Tax=uncultured Clostridium sp. TaxID=59620 RepID=UPI002609D545|nr:flagellar hook-basal body complex protein [uncultured Clostridium sp.]
MIRGLYTAVSGMVTLEAKQASITNNLANINTTGYKAEELILKSFDEVMLQNKDNKQNQKRDIGGISLGVEIDGTYKRKDQGIMSTTDNTTDFAIDGEGYFVFEGMNEYNYSRNGNFKVGTNGYMFNSNGQRVMGENIRTGEFEPIFVGNDDFRMNTNNEISVNGKPAEYRILTAKFDEDKQPNFDERVYIAQGNTEKSNVNLVDEMANMIGVMRAFETNQKIVQTMDEVLGKAANEIGAVR